ncbi:MAG: TetR/AcrR family transcriptional regulator [Thermomicrobiales bacterium]
MANERQNILSETLRKNLGGTRRSEILDAAALVIIERGFEQTRFTDIAKASGVSVGTLQHYFGGLEALLIEACLETCDADFRETSTIADSITSPWDRLLWVTKMMMACDRPGRAWQVRIELWHAAVSRPYLRDEVARMQNEWHGLVESALRYGIDGGVFDSTVDVARLAVHLAATCGGSVFPVWMNNARFDIVAFEAYVVDDLAGTLGSYPEGFIDLDVIERTYRPGGRSLYGFKPSAAADG